ncbi:MAG: PEGA domain-containing protein [bacterium]
MTSIGLIALLLLGAPAPDSGYVTVRSTLPGIEVYLDGDYLGRTPVARRAFRTGSFLLTIVSNDSLENVYATIRSGPVGGRLSGAWTLAAIDAGTYRVEVRPNSHAEVTIDYGRVLAAPGRAKTFACCAVSGLAAVGAALGFLIGWLVFK